MKCRTCRAVLGVCALTTLAGCGVDESVAPAPSPLPPALEAGPVDAPGPYRVGVTSVIAEDPDGDRHLPVEVWYPALAEADAPAATYTLELGALELGELASPYGAVRDAPADLRGAPHPVVVFSHGSGGIRFQSVYLTEYLATHGFVVAAPDHLGNTFQEEVDGAEALSRVAAAHLRPRDVTRTLDWLLALSADAGGALASMADAERVGIAGHSFGGFTAFRIAGATIDLELGAETCASDAPPDFCDGWGTVPLTESARDERFLAALAQAPGGAEVFQGGGLADVALPTMIQAGTADQTTPYDEEAAAPFAELTTEAYLLALEGAGHFTFSDACAITEQLSVAIDAFQDGCSPENIPLEVAQPIIVRYATAFLRARVAGDASVVGELAAGGPLPEGVVDYRAK